MFTVEDMVQHTKQDFDNKREANEYKRAMESRFPGVRYVMYPAEIPDPPTMMCELCGDKVAAHSSFLCEDCEDMLPSLE